MIKKRYLAMISILMMLGLSVSIFRYIETIKTEIVNAAQTIPNPGHSWASMESGTDSIQVTGKTITNLATPVTSTDAANKAYVDSVSAGGAYQSCYVGAGTSCATGFTLLASVSGTTGVYAYGGVCSGAPTPSPVVNTWQFGCCFTMGTTSVCPGLQYTGGLNYIALYGLGGPSTPSGSGTAIVACCK